MTTSITQIKIIPINPNKGLVGFASFVINEYLYISSVAIYTRPNKPDNYRLVYPGKLVGNKQINLVYPIDNQIGEYIEKEISKEVQKVINQKCDQNVGYFYTVSQRV